MGLTSMDDVIKLSNFAHNDWLRGDGTLSVIYGAFQTGYVALRRAVRSENNHGHHIEVSFQTEVLKISHFKGPFGMKDFEGYN